MFKLILIFVVSGPVGGVSTVLHPVTFDTLRECDTVGRMTSDNIHSMSGAMETISWTCSPTTADYTKIRNASQEPEGDYE